MRPVSAIARLADFAGAVQFIRKLATPITDTNAYHLGIIDRYGYRTSKPLNTIQEKRSWTYMDVICNNLKKMLAKIPGGSSQIATLAAAMMLLREENLTEYKLETIFNEYFDSLQSIIEAEEEHYAEKAIRHNNRTYTRENFPELANIPKHLVHHRHLMQSLGANNAKRGYTDWDGKFYDANTLVPKRKGIRQFHEDGATVAVNNTGNVAGIGNPTNSPEPGVYPKQKDKYKRANKKAELNMTKIVLGMVKR